MTFGVILILLLLDTTICIFDVRSVVRGITLTFAAPSATFKERHDVLSFKVARSLFLYMVCMQLNT